MWRLTSRDHPEDPSFSLVLQDEPYYLGRSSDRAIAVPSTFTGVSKNQGFLTVKVEDEENPRETDDSSTSLTLYYTDTSTRGAVIRGTLWVSKANTNKSTRINPGDVISLGSRIPAYPDEKDLCYAFIATFEKDIKTGSSSAVDTSIPFSPSSQNRVKGSSKGKPGLAPISPRREQPFQSSIESSHVLVQPSAAEWIGRTGQSSVSVNRPQEASTAASADPHGAIDSHDANDANEPSNSSSHSSSLTSQKIVSEKTTSAPIAPPPPPPPRPTRMLPGGWFDVAKERSSRVKSEPGSTNWVEESEEGFAVQVVCDFVPHEKENDAVRRAKNNKRAREKEKEVNDDEEEEEEKKEDTTGDVIKTRLNDYYAPAVTKSLLDSYFVPDKCATPVPPHLRRYYQVPTDYQVSESAALIGRKGVKSFCKVAPAIHVQLRVVEEVVKEGGGALERASKKARSEQTPSGSATVAPVQLAEKLYPIADLIPVLAAEQLQKLETETHEEQLDEDLFHHAELVKKEKKGSSSSAALMATFLSEGGVKGSMLPPPPRGPSVARRRVDEDVPTKTTNAVAKTSATQSKMSSSASSKFKSDEFEDDVIIIDDNEDAKPVAPQSLPSVKLPSPAPVSQARLASSASAGAPPFRPSVQRGPSVARRRDA